MRCMHTHQERVSAGKYLMGRPLPPLQVTGNSPLVLKAGDRAVSSCSVSVKTGAVWGVSPTPRIAAPGALTGAVGRVRARCRRR